MNETSEKSLSDLIAMIQRVLPEATITENNETAAIDAGRFLAVLWVRDGAINAEWFDHDGDLEEWDEMAGLSWEEAEALLRLIRRAMR